MSKINSPINYKNRPAASVIVMLKKAHVKGFLVKSKLRHFGRGIRVTTTDDPRCIRLSVYSAEYPHAGRLISFKKHTQYNGKSLQQ